MQINPECYINGINICSDNDDKDDVIPKLFLKEEFPLYVSKLST